MVCFEGELILGGWGDAKQKIEIKGRYDMNCRVVEMVMDRL